MRTFWIRFRESASRKEERGHFGLAWSVIAAYCLALSLMFLGFGRSVASVITVLHVFALFFIVFGAMFSYLALAVAMRWPPHNPRKPDEKKLQQIELIFYEGKLLLENWGQTTKQSRVERLGSDGVLKTNQFVRMSQLHADQLLNWIPRSEKEVAACLGTDLANRYKMSPDLAQAEPLWAEETVWVGLYQNTICRLSWLRTWSQNQFDL